MLGSIGFDVVNELEYLRPLCSPVIIGHSMPQIQYHYYATSSGNDTVLLETKIIHRFVHSFLYLLPIRSPLNELVDILFTRRPIISINGKTDIVIGYVPLADRPLHIE